MKNINKIFSLAFVAILTAVTFTSCEYDQDKARFPALTNGGFVKFVSAPEFDMGADPATASFSAMTEDPNGTVATYEVTVVGDFDGAPSEALPFGSTTTFPYDVSFTTADMAELFGVDVSTFVEDDSFEFFGVVTTVDGVVYNGTAPSGSYPDGDDPENAGSWNGGQTNNVLLTAPGLLGAFNWEVSYEDPN
jgi:hypothetical protein